MDSVARPEILQRGIRLSSSAGYSVEALAEHALFFMLSLAFRSMDLYDSQRKSTWEKSDRDHLRSLYKHTVGIVGLGHIGQALAVRCEAMQMRVLGYRRSDGPLPKGVHKVFCEQNSEESTKLVKQHLKKHTLGSLFTLEDRIPVADGA
jgi:phosphoglycerate dehydrogenase-like enzyme